jgi:AraC-like DNA-binding protein
LKKGQENKVIYSDLKIYHQNFPKKQLGLHSHNEAHLFIPLKGEIWLEFESERKRVIPGKMLFIPENTYHAFDSSEVQGERIVVMMKPLKIKIEETILPLNNLLKEILFHLLVSSDEVSSTSAKKFFFFHLKEILKKDKPAELSSLASKAKDERVSKALKIMEHNLELKISDVARQSAIAPKTLTRLFQLELNLSPKSVQSLFRVEKAKDLILAKKLSITEISYQVGFNSLSQFIASFRQYTGKLPSEF